MEPRLVISSKSTGSDCYSCRLRKQDREGCGASPEKMERFGDERALHILLYLSKQPSCQPRVSPFSVPLFLLVCLPLSAKLLTECGERN